MAEERKNMQTQPPGPWRRRGAVLTTNRLALVVILVFSVFAVYGNALFNGFVYDDSFQVLGNRWITDFRYVPDIFTQGVWGFKSESLALNYYRPLMHMIYLVNYHLFGLQPWGFHFVNVLFHAGVSILVFLITARLIGRAHPSSVSPRSPVQEKSALMPAFVAALLFAVHPIHTEAVVWVAAITDVAFTFFALLSLLLYMVSEPGLRAGSLASVLAFFAATLLKEPALTLPVILAAYDGTIQGRFSPSGTARRLAPYGAAAAIYFLLRYRALGGIAPFREDASLSIVQYALTVCSLFSQYLEKLFLPVNLNLWHVLHPVHALFTVQAITSLLVAAVFLALLFLAFRKNRTVFFCLVLIAVPLIPTFYISGIYGHPFAERYLYLPSAGFVMLFALFASSLMTSKPGMRPALIAGVAALTILYSLGTIGRNAVWKSDYTLFSDTVAKSPGADDPRVRLGNALLAQGKIDEAQEQYRAALAINPGHVMAHSDLGNALLRQGRVDEAIEEYRISLKLNPNYDEAHNNLGGAYHRKGLIDEAIEQYRTALKLSPRNAEVHFNLGLAYGEKGLPDQAIEQFQAALRLRPGFVQAYYNLGLAYGKRGLLDRAIEQFKTALQYDPDNVGIRDSLGTAYLAQGSVDDAIEQYRRALAISPENAPSHYYLGKALEKKGLRAEAAEHFRMAEKSAPHNPLSRGDSGRESR